MVEKLSKEVIFTPKMETVDRKEVAHLFEVNVFSKHGVPENVSSDRDPKFTKIYWNTLTASK